MRQIESGIGLPGKIHTILAPLITYRDRAANSRIEQDGPAYVGASTGGRDAGNQRWHNRAAVQSKVVDAEIPALSPDIGKTEAHGGLIIGLGQADEFDALGFHNVIVHARTDAWTERAPLFR